MRACMMILILSFATSALAHDFWTDTAEHGRIWIIHMHPKDAPEPLQLRPYEKGPDYRLAVEPDTRPSQAVFNDAGIQVGVKHGFKATWRIVAEDHDERAVPAAEIWHRLYGCLDAVKPDGSCQVAGSGTTYEADKGVEAFTGQFIAEAPTGQFCVRIEAHRNGNSPSPITDPACFTYSTQIPPPTPGLPSQLKMPKQLGIEADHGGQ